MFDYACVNFQVLKLYDLYDEFLSYRRVAIWAMKLFGFL